MSKHGKRYGSAAAKVEAARLHTMAEACEVVAGGSGAKFDETVEVSAVGFLPEFLKGVGAGKILTVSTGKDFARYGVMVNLSKDGSNFKYEINTMVVDGAGLKIDDSILKSATKI